jgi:epoxyqueuosine reductase
MAARQEELRGRLRGIGFDEVRFVALVPRPGGDGLQEWLKAGYHGEMGWMERTAAKRLDPDLVLNGARSAILLGVDYFDGKTKETRGAPGELAGTPAWARYSLYGDYHDSLKAALVSAGLAIEEIYGAAPADYRYYVDTGPVLERAWAALAGVGFIGKNSMLISRTHGNWLFLASILTRLDLESDPPLRSRGDPGAVGLLCGKCSRCMDACPTQAFPAPGVVDSRRCISYQTIENKGVIPRELRANIGNRIYGCDTCLDVCPWNRFAQEGRRMILSARAEIAAIPLRELLELTRERFADAFRGTPIKRVKWAGLLRNACVVAGNSGDRSLIDPLVRLASHESPVVRAHAVWAVRKLGGSDRLTEARQSEADEGVLEEYGCASDMRPARPGAGQAFPA